MGLLNADDGLRAAIEIRRRLPGTRCWCSPQSVTERPAPDLIGDSAARVGYLLRNRLLATGRAD
jgi:hypothetical protein